MGASGVGDGPPGLALGGLRFGGGRAAAIRMEREIRDLIAAQREIARAAEESRRLSLVGGEDGAPPKATGGSGQSRARLTPRALDAPGRPDLEGAPRAGQEARREEPPAVKASALAARRQVALARAVAELGAEVTERDERRVGAEGAKATGPAARRVPQESTRAHLPDLPAAASARAATFLRSAIAPAPSNEGPHIDLLF